MVSHYAANLARRGAGLPLLPVAAAPGAGAAAYGARLAPPRPAALPAILDRSLRTPSVDEVDPPLPVDEPAAGPVTDARRAALAPVAAERQAASQAAKGDALPTPVPHPAPGPSAATPAPQESPVAGLPRPRKRPVPVEGTPASHRGGLSAAPGVDPDDRERPPADDPTRASAPGARPRRPGSDTELPGEPGTPLRRLARLHDETLSNPPSASTPPPSSARYGPETRRPEAAPHSALQAEPTSAEARPRLSPTLPRPRAQQAPEASAPHDEAREAIERAATQPGQAPTPTARTEPAAPAASALTARAAEAPSLASPATPRPAMLPAQRLSGVGQQARPATTEVRPISVRIGSVELRAPAPEVPPAAPAPDVGFGEYLWMRTYAGWQHV